MARPPPALGLAGSASRPLAYDQEDPFEDIVAPVAPAAPPPPPSVQRRPRPFALSRLKKPTFEEYLRGVRPQVPSSRPSPPALGAAMQQRPRPIALSNVKRLRVEDMSRDNTKQHSGPQPPADTQPRPRPFALSQAKKPPLEDILRDGSAQLPPSPAREVAPTMTSLPPAAKRPLPRVRGRRRIDEIMAQRGEEEIAELHRVNESVEKIMATKRATTVERTTAAMPPEAESAPQSAPVAVIEQATDLGKGTKKRVTSREHTATTMPRQLVRASQPALGAATDQTNVHRREAMSPLPEPPKEHVTALVSTATTMPPKIEKAPQSALEAVMHQANDLGEETMASLQDIVQPNTADSYDNLEELLTDEELIPSIRSKRHQDPAIKASPYSNKIPGSSRLTQAQKDQRQEDLAMEALSKRLDIAHTTVHDANRGLRRLSNKIDAEEQREERIMTLENTETIKQLPHTCTCCHHDSIWKQAGTELITNLYHNQHITWLGWTLMLWLIWYCLETSLCTYFCDDLYGPLIPFVTLNIMLRPLFPILRPVANLLAHITAALFNIAFGETASSGGTSVRPSSSSSPTFVTSEMLHTAASVTRNIVLSTVDAVDGIGDGFAWDEYL